MAITTCVHVWVKPENVEEFIQASIENHLQSRKEAGNLRFDVCQDPNDSGKFMLYEAYIDEHAVAAHKETAHYQKWRDTVASMMAQPRQGSKYKVLAY